MKPLFYQYMRWSIWLNGAWYMAINDAIMPLKIFFFPLKFFCRIYIDVFFCGATLGDYEDFDSKADSSSVDKSIISMFCFFPSLFDSFDVFFLFNQWRLSRPNFLLWLTVYQNVFNPTSKKFNPAHSLSCEKSCGCQWTSQRRPFTTTRYTTFNNRGYKVWEAVTTPTRTYHRIGSMLRIMWQ